MQILHFLELTVRLLPNVSNHYYQSLLTERGSTLKLADKIGASSSAVRQWKSGKTEPSRDYLVATAEALNVSLVWLATGEGEESYTIDPVDLRLVNIEAKLSQTSIPMDEDNVRAAPEWGEIREELEEIANNEDVGESKRARANLFLRLVFSNEVAERRHKQRLADVGECLRRSRRVCDSAALAVGWMPPPMLLEALRTSAFVYDMKENEVILLLDAIRRVVDND